MVQPPVARDFAFVKSSVPFPSSNNNQAGAPQDHRRQRTGSNSSSTSASSSSGFGPSQFRSPTTSMSGRPQKQLSPVVEESEDDHSRGRWASGSRAGYRTSRLPRSTSYVGQTGLTAEDITIAMISMMPPTRHQTKPTSKQRTTGKTKSRFKNFRQSIRVRLPTMRFVRVWRRS